MSGSYVHVCPRHSLSTYFLNPLIQRDHTLSVPRALMPYLVAVPPHVCRRQETGLSLWARTYSKTWVFLERLHMQAHRSNCWKPLTSLASFEKLTIVSPVTYLSCASVATRVFRPAGRHLPRMTHTCTCTYFALTIM